jgi:sporulation protein YlmC with PRC-barrel domain
MIAPVIALTGVLSLGAAPVWAQQSNKSAQKSESRQQNMNSGLIAAEDLKGHRVVDSQNKEVGKIQNLFIDPNTGKVQRADIDFSIGNNETYSVTWDKLKVKEQAKEKGKEKQIVVTVDDSIVKRMQQAEKRGEQGERQGMSQQQRRASSQQ